MIESRASVESEPPVREGKRVRSFHSLIVWQKFRFTRELVPPAIEIGAAGRGNDLPLSSVHLVDRKFNLRDSI